MPPRPPPKAPAPTNPKKRKGAPHTHTHKNNDAAAGRKKHKPNDHHRAKQRDARALATQTTSKAFSHGALDVDKFVQAREYEIRALEDGIRRSKGALNRRAFQQVPKELRRRGAAHDAGRVPTRLRGRARREMAEDNTPTVKKGRRELTRQQRLRIETAKKLRALGSRRKVGKKVSGGEDGGEDVAKATALKKDTGNITIRAPRVKKATPAKPPLPPAKFRKRQKHKSWLPTHIFHAKRAHMTAPSAPMWRFALPLSPTQKSYRPTHRASSERGTVCWDTSYMATIALYGEERSVLGMLRALGVEQTWLSGVKGTKWRAGTRVVESMVYQREAPHHLIAPVTMIWSALPHTAEQQSAEAVSKRKRKLFLRVHPSAFFELWEEVVRLSKVAKPGVRVEDLRFEIGSIELKGPGSTEALLGALWPSTQDGESGAHVPGSVEQTWLGLAGLTNAGALPSGALLAFDIQDPKLHMPPRTVKLPSQNAQDKLLELLASWPPDTSQQPPAIFDAQKRHLGSRLPSQKAVNRRKSLAPPGSFPDALPTDPRTPVLVYTSQSSTNANKASNQSTSWHLLAPWKAIQPIWYSLMYYPLSTGRQPRFGGLEQQRQLAFEAGQPWFPGDFPGTKAGWEWEVVQRRRRWEDWTKRPKGKRVSWERVQVGEGKEGRGEVGVGWACDWEILLGSSDSVQNANAMAIDGGQPPPEGKHDENGPAAKKDAPPPEAPAKPKDLSHISVASATALLANPTTSIPPTVTNQLTIRLTLLTRGVPQTCARIYILPTNPDLRKAWLALHPSQQNQRNKKPFLPKTTKDTSSHVQRQRLAASLLEPPRAGAARYPFCPGKEDLVGFVTSGNFNLAEGKGTGVGCVLFERVLRAAREAQEGELARVCVVRNAGEEVARLARWDVA